MPRRPANAVSRILERMVLEVLLIEPDAGAPSNEPFPVGRDEVRQSTAEPEVTVQPEAAAHRVDHALAAITELHPLESECRGIRWRVVRLVRRGEPVAH